MKPFLSISLLGFVLIFYSCSQESAEEKKAQLTIKESKKANDYFDRWYAAYVDRRPETQTRYGYKTNQDQWNDRTESGKQKELTFAKEALQWLKDSVQFSALDRATQISFDLFVSDRQKYVDDYEFRYYKYPVTQRSGVHTSAPNALINYHKIESIKDAQDYIARVGKFDTLLDQVMVNMDSAESAGVIVPKFTFPKIIESCENLIAGISNSNCTENTIFKDFATKLEKLGLDETQSEDLKKSLSDALNEKYKPAYEKLISYLTSQENRATTDDGVWKFPNGEKYYTRRLQRMTTTQLTAEEIHETGLKEVGRIQGEMKEIMKTVGYEGTLNDFFRFLRTDPQFYYPNTDAGKEAYMDSATAIINNMRSRLDQLFITKPKTDMIVKRVEAYREESASKAFYYRPALDGSRPGIYYANLKNSMNMPKYEMEALAYHEGIPGHHMQLAINQELTGLPNFRKHISATAFTEGWGLYSERVPKEIGLYQNPYSDYGRLAMELWRACRLVVDTGIHWKKWTRDEAYDYYLTNTSGSERECLRMVDRHIVNAGQATAYKVGMMKILELRESAKEQLGDKFDIREFHDVVITNGIIPLDLLDRLVNEWVDSKMG